MPIITIAGTPIDFPNTGASPVWSDAVIEFAQLVEEALSGLVGTGDISKQAFTLDSSMNPATNITLTGLSFSTAVVRAAFIKYSVYRSTSAPSPATAYEAGEMVIVYNPANPTNQKWELQREYVGDGKITFTIDDSGQFSFSTTAITGTAHTGKISFLATALIQ